MRADPLPRQIPTAELLAHLPSRPHDIYREAMQRKSALLDNVNAQPKVKRPTIFADIDRLTVVIQTFYRNHEGGAGGL